MSSVLTFNGAYDDESGWATAHQVFVSDGGRIDLSGLQTLLGPARGEDWQQWYISSGGSVDFSSLRSISSVGTTEFEVTLASFDLPSLESATGASFVLNGTASEMAVLNDVTNTSFSASAGAAVSLPVLGSHDGGSYTVADGCSVSAPNLLSAEGVTLTVEEGGTFQAGRLTSFTRGYFHRHAGQTLDLPVFVNADDSRFKVTNGETLTVSAENYACTNLRSGGSTYVLFEVSGESAEKGTPSLLDMSSVLTFNGAYNDESGWATAHQVSVSDGGRIDLSGVQTLLGPARGEDRQDWFISSGGEVDMGSLSSITGYNVRFYVSAGGRLTLGDLTVTGNTTLSVTDGTSEAACNGGLFLDAGSSVSITNGATLRLRGDFRIEHSDEGSFTMDAGVLHMNGTGGQWFEAAGEDVGAKGAKGSNFGIGQFVIGRTAQRTSVELIDAVDNGNRGATGTEAVYLFGLGGPDGLRILNDSAMVLNGINVYAWDAAAEEMVHLNGLFGAGELRISFDDGYLQLVPLDFQWSNPDGGAFSVGGNWSDNLVPLPSDAALWNLGSVGGYAVQFGTNVATDSAIVKNDNVTFELGGFDYTAAGLHATESIVVGLDESDVGRLTIVDGTLAGRSARIAASGGSEGTLTVGAGGMLDIEEDLFVGVGDGALIVQADGKARVGTTLTVAAGSRVELAGGAATVGSGALETAPDTMGLRADGTVLGVGSILGHVVSAGTISPGMPAGGKDAPAIGELTIDGSFTQQAGGVLTTDIVGAGAGEFDLLTVSGEASLGGGLELALDGELPMYGGLAPLVSANVTGQFATVAGVIVDSETGLAVTYNPTAVVVTRALLGDVTLDGRVDYVDLGTLASYYDATGVTWAQGDFSGDGRVDYVDLGLLSTAYGRVVGQSAPVPEPLTAALLALGAAALLGRRRGRQGNQPVRRSAA